MQRTVSIFGLGLLSWLLLAVGLSPALVAGAEWRVVDPDIACRLLADDGLATRGGYKHLSGSTYRCASFRVPMPLGGAANHEVRFFADGTEAQVRVLNLQLYVRSHDNIQAAHQRLLGYARTLSAKALGRSLPEQVASAMLSVNVGRFLDDDVEWILEKAQIRGVTYEYFVRLQPAGR